LHDCGHHAMNHPPAKASLISLTTTATKAAHTTTAKKASHASMTWAMAKRITLQGKSALQGGWMALPHAGPCVSSSSLYILGERLTIAIRLRRAAGATAWAGRRRLERAWGAGARAPALRYGPVTSVYTRGALNPCARKLSDFTIGFPKEM
jgi:hypothetical protein